MFVHTGYNKVMSNDYVPGYTAVTNLPFELCLYKLGHVSHSRVSILYKFIPKIVSDFGFHCNICPMQSSILAFP